MTERKPLGPRRNRDGFRQARRTEQHVVRDAEHLIQFVIRQRHLQHLHVPIERVNQSRVLRQPMHRADPATRQPAHPITVLVQNVAGPYVGVACAVQVRGRSRRSTRRLRRVTF
jgi:hypothetical protein